MEKYVLPMSLTGRPDLTLLRRPAVMFARVGQLLLLIMAIIYALVFPNLSISLIICYSFLFSPIYWTKKVTTEAAKSNYRKEGRN